MSAKEALDRIAASKLARLPFEEKFRMVVEMNRLAAQARGSLKRAD